MQAEAVDQYFLEEGVAAVAVERYHLEQSYRRLWLNRRSKKKQKCRKNRRLPFGMVIQELLREGIITKVEKTRLNNTYNRLSKLVHITRLEDL